MAPLFFYVVPTCSTLTLTYLTCLVCLLLVNSIFTADKSSWHLSSPVYLFTESDVLQHLLCK